MENVARVVLALEAHDVAEEVMHFLDRSGRARVIATADDRRQLAEAVRQLDPDAVVAQPTLVAPGAIRGRSFIALDVRESVGSLRAAIDAGARGFFLWPSDRERLVSATAASTATPVVEVRRASVIAVHGSRGGVGTTFVATHLAAALARRGADCVLIDADPAYDDVTAALGAPAEGVHSLGDLLPLAREGELSVGHVVDALWAHEAGFRVLLAAGPATTARGGHDGETSGLSAVVDVAGSACDVVVLHLPRTLDGATFDAIEGADRVLEVVTLDVLSLRATGRALDRYGSPNGRVGYVLNRVARGELGPGDAVRVFATPPIAVIPHDRVSERSQDHGRLVTAKGRIVRIFDRLAATLMDLDPSDESATKEGR